MTNPTITNYFPTNAENGIAQNDNIFVNSSGVIPGLSDLDLIPTSASSAPLAAAPSADASLATLPTTTTYTGNTAKIVAPDLQITGSGELSGARVTLAGTGIGNQETLSVSGVPGNSANGVSWTYDAATGTLTFTGTAALDTYKNLLNKVAYTNSGASAPTDRKVQFSLGNLLANPENGHFYEFVTNQGISWNNAKSAADGRNYLGRKGYLGTITNVGEQAFIQSRVQGNGWIGASDSTTQGTTEGNWKWVTGPEAGQDFWRGIGVDANANQNGAGPVQNRYNNWDLARNEPNNDNAGSASNKEDYAHIVGNTQAGSEIGKWNDLPEDGYLGVAGIEAYVPEGYIVEYGGLQGDGSNVIAASVSLTFGAVPANTQLTNPDFKSSANKNGRPDILWRNNRDGRNASWVLDYNASAENAFTLNAKTKFIWQVPEQGWEVEGLVDINKDNISDIIWRNYRDGRNAFWIMKDDAQGIDINLAQSDFFFTIGDTNWEIEGVTDLGNDGDVNILWRNYKSGENAIWGMNYNASATGQNRFTFNPDKTKYISPVTDTNWVMEGWTDFSGDGVQDIAWRNYSTGQNEIWKLKNDATGANPYFNPGDKYSILSVPAASNGWEIEDTIDFNKDGIGDILWRNYSTGQNAIWIMQAGGDYDPAKTDFLAPIITDNRWNIEGVADFTGDGIPDILWRNYGSGAESNRNAIWRLKEENGKIVLDKGFFINSTDDLQWEIQGPTATNDFN